MAITLKPMSINAGDPVTSDLLSLIIQNLQTVAKGETVSNIAVDASGLSNATDPTKKATVAYNTIVPVPSSVKVSSAASATDSYVSSLEEASKKILRNLRLKVFLYFIQNTRHDV